MPTCTHCSSDLPESSRFCPGCGKAVETGPGTDATALPTRVAGKQAPLDQAVAKASRTATMTPGGSPAEVRETSASAGAAPAAALVSSGSVPSDGARFLPGVIVDERYRIVALLGKGAMGEVYRADDLRLGQPVALKFLPEVFASNPARRERFLNEVRIARQVTHPNVCRVYDIGEVDGNHYISMEYIDGEDLSSLLRRIGRLPEDRAIEISREICAGLAAAHGKGILHRDLKPANVMIDGRGHPRITDFGLAAVAEQVQGAEIKSGTPAYMAPEQFAGTEVSTRSDIYSLGLVLHEIFTGKHGMLVEGGIARWSDSASGPPSHLSGFDPSVGRTIALCLDEDPDRRPQSAVAVAAALPGGDPLSAALAAGETPSPDMVAAAGEEGIVRPAVAAAWGAALLIGIVLSLLLAQSATMTGAAAPGKRPEALEDRAGEILNALGHDAPALDVAQGFAYDLGPLEYVRQNDTTPDRWRHLGRSLPAVIYYWHRRSAGSMIPRGSLGRVTLQDPPAATPGMAALRLSPDGLLIGLEIRPIAGGNSRNETDWNALLSLTGLTPAEFTTVEPESVPPMHSDERRAWEGIHPAAENDRVRIEAAALGGKPIYLTMEFQRSTPTQSRAVQATAMAGQAKTYASLLLFLILPVAGFLARRNVRLGRGDRRGAVRISGFLFSAFLLTWLFGTNHVPSAGGEWDLFLRVASVSLFLSALVWLLYLGLEPFVRRRWPWKLIAWSRLLDGRFRDPLVGKEILSGAALGTGLVVVTLLRPMVSGWLGGPPDAPIAFPLSALAGPGLMLSEIFRIFIPTLIIPMLLLMIMMVTGALFRKTWLAAVLSFLLFLPLISLGLETGWSTAGILAAGLFVAIMLLTLTRFGLLALMAAMFVNYALTSLPLTTDLSAWYLRTTWLALAAVIGLAGFGIWASLGRRALIADELSRA